MDLWDGPHVRGRFAPGPASGVPRKEMCEAVVPVGKIDRWGDLRPSLLALRGFQ